MIWKGTDRIGSHTLTSQCWLTPGSFLAPWRAVSSAEWVNQAYVSLNGRQTHYHLYTLPMTSTLILTAALLVGLGLNQINEHEKNKKR